MSRVLLLLAAAYAKDDDDDAAWIERWRRGGASRCTRTHCGWLADAGPIDVGCEFEISQTGLAKRGASSKAPELAVRPGGGPARSFAPHELDEALDVPSLCAYREPGTIHGEDRTRQRGVVALVAACVEINHWFGGSPPNFRTLYLNQIEVNSADFWTDRLLSSSSRNTAKESGPNRSITRKLRSG